MTINESYERNLIKSIETGAYHPADLGLRVNDEDVTFTVFNDIILKSIPNILKAKNKIIAIIKAYISKNSSILGLRSPTERILFLESDKNAIFKAVGIDKNELYNSIQSVNANDIDTSNHLIEDAFNTLCVIICGVFLREDKALLEKIKKCDKVPLNEKDKYNNNTPIFYVSYYLAIRFYGAIYNHFFRVANPNKQVMDYTIESLSNKFMIRKMSNMGEFIKYCSDTNIENMYDRIYRMSDVDLFYFTSNLHNRISHAMKTIAQNYYKNFSENNKIGTDDANKVNEEGKKYVDDVSSISGDLLYAVRKITTAFYSETVIDQQLLVMACNRTAMSKSRMTLIIKKIRDEKDTDKFLTELINLIIAYYLTTEKGKIDEIRSSKFAVAMIKVYSISNTKDKYVLRMKEIMRQLIHNNLTTIVDEMNKNLVDRVSNSLYTYIVLFCSSRMP